MVWLVAGAGLLLLIAVLYWQLIIAEGAYLGRKVVALLYDWSAHLYDGIKRFDTRYERYFLARPLVNAVFSFPNPVVLDVATGTARLPRALFPEVGFRGKVIGLDLSRKMLAQAVAKTARWKDRCLFVWDDATTLPFPDGSFEVVTCLEALEFMPDPRRVLAEMVRVLRPGGLLLTTNRIGRDARWLPGRTYSAEALEAYLQELSLEMIQIRPWQEDYDLVWASKPGACEPLPPRPLVAFLCCPQCGQPLDWGDLHTLRCEAGHRVPVGHDGIVEMVRARARHPQRR